MRVSGGERSRAGRVPALAGLVIGVLVGGSPLVAAVPAQAAPAVQTVQQSAGALTTDLGPISFATPSQRVTLIGAGFGGSVGITASLDSTVLATSVADTVGELALPVTLPPGLASGSHTLTVGGAGPDGVDRLLTLAVTTPPTALTSSGDDEQWATIPVPAGGWVTLLDADRAPVTATTFRGQGTYTLDPATGEISFQPRQRFYGTARAATFQLTDADGQTVTGTYTATVLPRAIPSIRAADRTLTSADTGTARIGCTAGPVPLSRCEASLSALVNGETVRLASGSAAAPGRIGTLNIDLALTDRGKRLAGAPGGWPVDVSVSIWLPGVAEPLEATGTTRLTALTVTAPRPILYDAGKATIPEGALPYLNALRSRMPDVTTVTCTGGTDGQGSPDADDRVAHERAQAVCDYLTANTAAQAVVLTSAQPGTSGLASARRTEITFSYAPAGTT